MVLVPVNGVTTEIAEYGEPVTLPIGEKVRATLRELKSEAVRKRLKRQAATKLINFFPIRSV